LNKWRPEKNREMRVFFPHNGPVKLMTATGDIRESTVSGPSGHEFLLRDEAGIPEWVPGWYVASLVAPDV
jgi:hypothetical protein